MGIFTLSALLVAGAGVYLFSKTFPNFNPGMKKLQADLNNLTKELDQINVDLIPLNAKDLESLSTKQTENSSKKRMTKNSRGAFVSIFEEAIFKYAAREYGNKKNDLIILANAGTHRYAYLSNKGKVQIVIDDQVLGQYDPESGTLSGSRTKKAIAQLDKNKPEQNLLQIKGRSVASMHKLKASDTKGLSKRVFEYVVDQLSAEELAVITAITIYELVRFAN